MKFLVSKKINKLGIHSITKIFKKNYTNIQNDNTKCRENGKTILIKNLGDI